MYKKNKINRMKEAREVWGEEVWGGVGGRGCNAAAHYPKGRKRRGREGGEGNGGAASRSRLQSAGGPWEQGEAVSCG